ncbi:alpha/beta hydrolase [Nocardioides panacihumi]|uniref:alpha/beta hydrolase n=1 Tax=Nocardioides panacihumi TaxID=400774 RepID=UPI0031D5D861
MSRWAYDDQLRGVVHDLPPLDLVDFRATRQKPRPPLGATPGVDVVDLTVEADDGHAIPVRAYRPVGAGTTLPGIVHFHGGGYVVGALDGSHGHCAALSSRLGAAVFSVGYRLAPEHPFPRAVEDGVAVLRWLHQTCGPRRVDPDRVAVHGRSAGAGLAARVAISARDAGLPLRFQYLNCPQLDPTATGGSMMLAGTAFLDADTVRVAWRHYLGDEGVTDAAVVAAASPLHHPDLRELPAAFVAVMQLDPVRDDGIAYAHRLLSSGVPVELHLYPGTFHCSSVIVPTAEVSVREIEEEVGVLRRALRVTAPDAATQPDVVECVAGPSDQKGQ